MAIDQPLGSIVSLGLLWLLCVDTVIEHCGFLVFVHIHLFPLRFCVFEGVQKNGYK